MASKAVRLAAVERQLQPQGDKPILVVYEHLDQPGLFVVGDDCLTQAQLDALVDQHGGIDRVTLIMVTYAKGGGRDEP